ncbi:MAG: tRNA lysidine(34) synthetase TilS [Pseudomonadota bacterium]
MVDGDAHRLTPSGPAGTGEPVATAVRCWLGAWRSGRRDPRVVTAFSGGLDSTVLLHALALACAEEQVPLRVVHVNHRSHAQSAAWADHCRQQAQQLQVPIDVRVTAEALDPSAPGFEARARRARFAAFATCVVTADSALALAHHANDQSETLLLRMFQGRGVVPMRSERPFADGLMVRPLLKLPKTALRAYAAHHALTWIDDPSNASEAPDRNWLRHRVLAPARDRWPMVDAQLARVAAEANERLTLLETLLRQRDALSRSELAGPDQRALLRSWLASRGEFEVTDRALDEFLRQLASPPDRRPRLRLASGWLLRDGDAVCYQSDGATES